MMNTLETSSDAAMVAESLTGNREAFGRIVARYQTLICSLAYSSTGSLSQSEDLAQETFIAAWKQLPGLREPHKLRPWLCGIARNLIYDALKKQGREPSHAAEPLDAAHEAPAPGLPPYEFTISREEEAILWRSIEQIPETYREPLILFYRKHQSIEAVAANLGLSEDAVKQRLSRGRKLLQEQVLAFVAGALARTNPGDAFTLSVLAALPALTFSFKAAMLGAAAKGGMAAKGATLGWLGWLLGPLIGVMGGYFNWREALKNARTPRERKFMIHNALIMVVGMLAFTVLFVTLNIFALGQGWKHHSILLTMIGLAIGLAWCAYVCFYAWRHAHMLPKIREEERQFHPELYQNVKPGLLPPCDEVWEYRSRITLLGLPLVHCRAGKLPGQKVQPAVGWIAYGARAYGILFAGGGITVGGISMGGVSFGIVSCGGLGFGMLAIGGLGAGVVAMGGAAIGWIASGSVALGWHAALGGMVLAREFALGGGGLAHHINDAAARGFFTHHPWLNFMQSGWLCCLFWLLCFTPTFLHLLLWRWARWKLAKRVSG